MAPTNLLLKVTQLRFRLRGRPFIFTVLVAMLFSVFTLIFLEPYILLTKRQSERPEFDPFVRKSAEDMEKGLPLRPFHSSLSSVYGKRWFSMAISSSFPRTSNTKIFTHRWYAGGEYFFVQSPLCLSRWRRRVRLHAPAMNDLSCMVFSRNISLDASKCLSYLSRVSRRYSTLLPTAVRHVKKLPQRITLWEEGTAVFLEFTNLETNVCHYLFRMLMVWNQMRRARFQKPAIAPEFANVRTIVIVCREGWVRNELIYRPGRRVSLQVGLLHRLFARWGINVVVVRHINDLLRFYSGAACFRHVVVVAGHSNRFAFPDSELAPVTTGPIQKYPLSTSALALRDAIFRPRKPPFMRNKLLYLSRRIGGWRSFDSASEARFRKMLAEIAKKHGAELKVFYGKSPYPNFEQQVALFGDTSVIVGFHGAGMSLGVFAPRNCSIVEINSYGHNINLFGNLVSSGLHFRKHQLRRGTSFRKGRRKWNKLVDEDLVALRQIVNERVAFGKKLVEEVGK